MCLAVFAINKVDKPDVSSERIKQNCFMNFLVEDWGGKMSVQDISR